MSNWRDLWSRMTTQQPPEPPAPKIVFEKTVIGGPDDAFDVVAIVYPNHLNLGGTPVRHDTLGVTSRFVR